VIAVTRLNGVSIHVNAEMIVFVEATPDTVLSLVNGDRVVIREPPQTIVDAVIAYRRAIHNWEPRVGAPESPGDARPTPYPSVRRS
jgi:flagellar protein FlbD